MPSAPLFGALSRHPRNHNGRYAHPRKILQQRDALRFRYGRKGGLPKAFEYAAGRFERGVFTAVFKEERDAELWRLIKAADKLSAYIKCIEERKAGNCEFEDAERTIRKVLDESECREAHIFLEEFIPAYELPLDKLK